MTQATASTTKERVKRKAYYEVILNAREKPVRYTAETTPDDWEKARKAQVGLNGTLVVVDDTYDAQGDFAGSTTVACLHMEVPQAREVLDLFKRTGEYISRSEKKGGRN